MHRTGLSRSTSLFNPFWLLHSPSARAPAFPKYPDAAFEIFTLIHYQGISIGDTMRLLTHPVSPVKSLRTRVVAFGWLLASSVPSIATAQTSAQQLDKPKLQSESGKPKPADNSSEAYVIEKFSSKLAYESDGTATEEDTARIRIQSQAGLHQWGILNFPYASGTSTQPVLSVHVIKPDGRVVQTPQENVLEMPAEITRQAPFYSDIKNEQVAVKGLEVGDVLEYEYRDQITKPLDPRQFWYSYNFFQTGVILSEDLEISVPRSRQIFYKSPDVQPLIVEQNDRRIYRWHTDHLQSKPEQDSEAADQDEKPPSVRITTFRNWDEVGDWFRSLIAPRAVVTPEIQAKADELTRGAKTDTEKIQAIYTFVSQKFRYIGIALGIGRYQPHAAADVLTNDYGDCKDKHTLFAALLAAEHIKAFPALINSSHKIDPDFPSPDQFDHVITAIPQDKGFLFLDTTPEVAPFGYLITGLRDKKAVVIPDAGPVQLADTPPDPPFKSFLTFEANGAIDDAGTFDGKMQFTLRGDQELLYRIAFRQAGEAQWKDVMQKISQSMGYAGTVSDVTVSPPDKIDDDFQFGYSYNRKEIGDWPNRRVPAPLPFLSLIAIPDGPLAKPFKLGSPVELTFKCAVKLPQNSHPVLPVPINLHEDFADYTSTCLFTDGVLRCERHFTGKKRELAPERADAYRNFQKTVIDDYSSMIPLSESAVAAGKSSNDGDAQAVFDQGRSYWQNGDISAARSEFLRSVKKDPKFAQGWLALGMADLTLGDSDDGAQEITKAVNLDPAQRTLGYTFAASFFATRHRDDDALIWWRRLEQADPDNLQAARNISAILLREQKYADAVPELEKAVRNNTEDVSLQIQLAEAYFHSGKTEQADAMFDRAAKGNPDSDTLNWVAYELADNNHRLDDALQLAEKAVNKIEDDTSDIDLDNLLQGDLKTPVQLAADWDTLGWVHFRLGHFDLAADYLKSAWNITQDPVVADHLGQVYEKEGKIHDAVIAYGRARAMGNAAPENSRARLNALRPNDKYQPGEHVDLIGIQEMRSAQVRRVTDKRVSAEFFILFDGDSKRVDAQFVSGSEDLRPAGKLFESAKLNVTFPKGSSARILRRGILDCQSGAPFCMFALIPPEEVHSLH